MSDQNEPVNVKFITSSAFGLKSEVISMRKVSDSSDRIASDSQSIDDAIKATLDAIYQAINDAKTKSLYNRLFSLLNAEIEIESVKGSISFMRFLYRFDALQLTTLIEKVIKEEDPIIQDALVECLQKNLVYVNEDGKDESIGLFKWTKEIREAALAQINLLKGYATKLESEFQTDLTKDKAAEATKIPEDMIKLIEDRDRETFTPEGKEPSSSEKLQNVVFKMRLLHTLHRSDKLFNEKRIGGKTWYEIAAKIAACILILPGLYILYKSMENKNPETYPAKYPKTLQRVLDIDKTAGFNHSQRKGAAPRFRGGKLFNKSVAVAGKEASHDSKEEEGESRKQSKSAGK